MKKIIGIIGFFFLVSNGFSQTETRMLGDFSTLEVSGALKVVLIKGTENKILITSEKPETLGRVKAEISDEQLSLFVEGKKVVKKKGKRTKTKTTGGDSYNVKIELTYKFINEIKLSGASEISNIGVVQTENFRIEGSGVTEISLNIETTELAIDFSGASEIKLQGTAEVFNLESSGASDVKASNFIVKDINIDVSGASDIEVNATESIQGTATGASSVNVKGSPAVKAINSSGASSSNYGNNNGVNIGLGKNKVVVDDNDDVDVRLGNKEVKVSADGDTTEVRWGATSVLVTDDSVWVHRDTLKPRRNHWAGIDLGINGFLNSNNSFNLGNDPALELTNPKKVTQFMELNYAKSWTISVNFMEFFFKIKEHHFGFVTGMGTEWNNYELKHNIRLNAEGGTHVFATVNEFNKGYTWGEVDTVLNYSKNRFKTWFVNVPLLFEYNSGNNKNKSFHLSAGAILGLNLQTKIKYKYNLNGKTKKDKDKQSFNTNPFRVGLTARVGYGWFTMFATYSLTPLFENGRGPELYPFAVGVSLLPF